MTSTSPVESTSCMPSIIYRSPSIRSTTITASQQNAQVPQIYRPDLQWLDDENHYPHQPSSPSLKKSVYKNNCAKFMAADTYIGSCIALSGDTSSNSAFAEIASNIRSSNSSQHDEHCHGHPYHPPPPHHHHHHQHYHPRQLKPNLFVVNELNRTEEAALKFHLALRKESEAETRVFGTAISMIKQKKKGVARRLKSNSFLQLHQQVIAEQHQHVLNAISFDAREVGREELFLGANNTDNNIDLLSVIAAVDSGRAPGRDNDAGKSGSPSPLPSSPLSLNFESLIFNSDTTFSLAKTYLGPRGIFPLIPVFLIPRWFDMMTCFDFSGCGLDDGSVRELALCFSQNHERRLKAHEARHNPSSPSFDCYRSSTSSPLAGMIHDAVNFSGSFASSAAPSLLAGLRGGRQSGRRNNSNDNANDDDGTGTVSPDSFSYAASGTNSVRGGGSPLEAPGATRNSPLQRQANGAASPAPFVYISPILGFCLDDNCITMAAAGDLRRIRRSIAPAAHFSVKGNRGLLPSLIENLKANVVLGGTASFPFASRGSATMPKSRATTTAGPATPAKPLQQQQQQQQPPPLVNFPVGTESQLQSRTQEQNLRAVRTPHVLHLAEDAAQQEQHQRLARQEATNDAELHALFSATVVKSGQIVQESQRKSDENIVRSNNSKSPASEHDGIGHQCGAHSNSKDARISPTQLSVASLSKPGSQLLYASAYAGSFNGSIASGNTTNKPGTRRKLREIDDERKRKQQQEFNEMKILNVREYVRRREILTRRSQQLNVLSFAIENPGPRYFPLASPLNGGWLTIGCLFSLPSFGSEVERDACMTVARRVNRVLKGSKICLVPVFLGDIEQKVLREKRERDMRSERQHRQLKQEQKRKEADLLAKSSTMRRRSPVQQRRTQSRRRLDLELGFDGDKTTQAQQADDDDGDDDHNDDDDEGSDNDNADDKHRCDHQHEHEREQQRHQQQQQNQRARFVSDGQFDHSASFSRRSSSFPFVSPPPSSTPLEQTTETTERLNRHIVAQDAFLQLGVSIVVMFATEHCSPHQLLHWDFAEANSLLGQRRTAASAVVPILYRRAPLADLPRVFRSSANQTHICRQIADRAGKHFAAFGGNSFVHDYDAAYRGIDKTGVLKVRLIDRNDGHTNSSAVGAMISGNDNHRSETQRQQQQRQDSRTASQSQRQPQDELLRPPAASASSCLRHFVHLLTSDILAAAGKIRELSTKRLASRSYNALHQCGECYFSPSLAQAAATNGGNDFGSVQSPPPSSASLLFKSNLSTTAVSTQHQSNPSHPAPDRARASRRSTSVLIADEFVGSRVDDKNDAFAAENQQLVPSSSTVVTPQQQLLYRRRSLQTDDVFLELTENEEEDDDEKKEHKESKDEQLPTRKNKPQAKSRLQKSQHQCSLPVVNPLRKRSSIFLTAGSKHLLDKQLNTSTAGDSVAAFPSSVTLSSPARRRSSPSPSSPSGRRRSSSTVSFGTGRTRKLNASSCSSSSLSPSFLAQNRNQHPLQHEERIQLAQEQNIVMMSTFVENLLRSTRALLQELLSGFIDVVCLPDDPTALGAMKLAVRERGASDMLCIQCRQIYPRTTAALRETLWLTAKLPRESFPSFVEQSKHQQPLPASLSSGSNSGVTVQFSHLFAKIVSMTSAIRTIVLFDLDCLNDNGDRNNTDITVTTGQNCSEDSTIGNDGTSSDNGVDSCISFFCDFSRVLKQFGLRVLCIMDSSSTNSIDRWRSHGSSTNTVGDAAVPKPTTCASSTLNILDQSKTKSLQLESILLSASCSSSTASHNRSFSGNRSNSNDVNNDNGNNNNNNTISNSIRRFQQHQPQQREKFALETTNNAPSFSLRNTSNASSTDEKTVNKWRRRYPEFVRFLQRVILVPRSTAFLKLLNRFFVSPSTGGSSADIKRVIKFVLRAIEERDEEQEAPSSIMAHELFSSSSSSPAAQQRQRQQFHSKMSDQEYVDIAVLFLRSQMNQVFENQQLCSTRASAHRDARDDLRPNDNSLKSPASSPSSSSSSCTFLRSIFDQKQAAVPLLALKYGLVSTAATSTNDRDHQDRQGQAEKKRNSKIDAADDDGNGDGNDDGVCADDSRHRSNYFLDNFSFRELFFAPQMVPSDDEAVLSFLADFGAMIDWTQFFEYGLWAAPISLSTASLERLLFTSNSTSPTASKDSNARKDFDDEERSDHGQTTTAQATDRTTSTKATDLTLTSRRGDSSFSLASIARLDSLRVNDHGSYPLSLQFLDALDEADLSVPYGLLSDTGLARVSQAHLLNRLRSKLEQVLVASASSTSTSLHRLAPVAATPSPSSSPRLRCPPSCRICSYFQLLNRYRDLLLSRANHLLTTFVTLDDDDDEDDDDGDEQRQRQVEERVGDRSAQLEKRKNVFFEDRFWALSRFASSAIGSATKHRQQQVFLPHTDCPIRLIVRASSLAKKMRKQQSVATTSVPRLLQRQSEEERSKMTSSSATATTSTTTDDERENPSARYLQFVSCHEALFCFLRRKLGSSSASTTASCDDNASLPSPFFISSFVSLGQLAVFLPLDAKPSSLIKTHSRLISDVCVVPKRRNNSLPDRVRVCVAGCSESKVVIVDCHFIRKCALFAEKRKHDEDERRVKAEQQELARQQRKVVRDRAREEKRAARLKKKKEKEREKKKKQQKRIAMGLAKGNDKNTGENVDEEDDDEEEEEEEEGQDEEEVQQDQRLDLNHTLDERYDPDEDDHTIVAVELSILYTYQLDDIPAALSSIALGNTIVIGGALRPPLALSGIDSSLRVVGVTVSSGTPHWSLFPAVTRRIVFSVFFHEDLMLCTVDAVGTVLIWGACDSPAPGLVLSQVSLGSAPLKVIANPFVDDEIHVVLSIKIVAIELAATAHAYDELEFPLGADKEDNASRESEGRNHYSHASASASSSASASAAVPPGAAPSTWRKAAAGNASGLPSVVGATCAVSGGYPFLTVYSNLDRAWIVTLNEHHHRGMYAQISTQQHNRGSGNDSGNGKQRRTMAIVKTFQPSRKIDRGQSLSSSIKNASVRLIAADTEPASSHFHYRQQCPQQQQQRQQQQQQQQMLKNTNNRNISTNNSNKTPIYGNEIDNSRGKSKYYPVTVLQDDQCHFYVFCDKVERQLCRYNSFGFPRPSEWDRAAVLEGGYVCFSNSWEIFWWKLE